MPARRFFADQREKGSGNGWVIRDRQREGSPLFFEDLGHCPTGGPMLEEQARAWARALNADDEPTAIFALSRVTGQPTAATREVVAEILAGEHAVILPWHVPAR